MVELPDDVIDEAVRLTRVARRATDEAEATAYREARDAALAEHGYRARVRTDEDPVLVCYPDDWLSAGVVDPTQIDDLDRAVERPLAGAGDPDDWESVEAHNREVAATVEAAHGPVHGANVHAFADFMGNHYARRVETAGPRECGEFLEEYLPRNAWPSDEQRAAARTTLRLVYETAGVEPPAWLEESAERQ